MKISGILLDVDRQPGRIQVCDVEENDLEEFYSILNCSTIDIVTRKIGDRVFDIVCDDEGLLKESPNVSAIAPDGKFMLVGNLFICNHYKAHLTSLSKEDVDHIMNHILIASFAKRKMKEVHTYPMLIDVAYDV